MKIEEYLKTIKINNEPKISENGWIIDLLNSTEYGKIFSKLENADDIEILEDNQVVTEQGSSLVYQSLSQPYLFTLLADWDGDIYQLVINEIED